MSYIIIYAGAERRKEQCAITHKEPEAYANCVNPPLTTGSYVVLAIILAIGAVTCMIAGRRKT